MSTKINHQQWITLHEMVRGHSGLMTNLPNPSTYRFDKMDYGDDFEMYRVWGSIQYIQKTNPAFMITDTHNKAAWIIKEYDVMDDKCKSFLHKVYKIWARDNGDRVKKLNTLFGKIKDMD